MAYGKKKSIPDLKLATKVSSDAIYKRPLETTRPKENKPFIKETRFISKTALKQRPGTRIDMSRNTLSCNGSGVFRAGISRQKSRQSSKPTPELKVVP